MKILSFDTSTRGLSLAVADDQKILCYRNLRSIKSLSSSIMPAIQSILKSSGLELNSLDGIIIGLGPGSFTSLRVGISTAKALAFAIQTPAVGVSSLDLLAMNVKRDGTVCVMNDARRGLVYACCYEKKGVLLKRLTDYLLDKPEIILKNVTSHKSQVTSVVIGDAIPLYKDLFKSLSSWTLIEDKKLYFPEARHLVTLGFDELKQPKDKARLALTDDLNPIYLYPDNCQVHKL